MRVEYSVTSGANPPSVHTSSIKRSTPKRSERDKRRAELCKHLTDCCGFSSLKMAEENKSTTPGRIILIPVDASNHSEAAFDCKYIEKSSKFRDSLIFPLDQPHQFLQHFGMRLFLLQIIIT